MRIGVIGTGNVGRSIAGLLARAGHEIRFGTRDPGREKAEGLPGPSGTVADAAAFGEVVLCATPYGIWRALAHELAPHVAGKIVIDAANPYPGRDGAFAQSAIDAGQGAGAPVAKLMPGARLVRAFNSVPWPAMVKEADRPVGERIAIPLAGDDAVARGIVASLITDAGFEPVDAGELVRARAFDPEQPAYNHPMSAAQMRRVLGLSG